MFDYTVFGCGVTGFSCVAFLRSLGKSCCLVDTRIAPPQLAEFQARFPDLPCYMGTLADEILLSSKIIILSPGIDPKLEILQEAGAKGTEIYGDIELFARYINQYLPTKTIIGITGSNGKSTVTTLVGELLKAAGLRVAIGGNLGMPALDLLDPNIDHYVLELSSFQLETTYSLKCTIASLLNLSEDHLDRHESMQVYEAIKQKIYKNAACAVINSFDLASEPQDPNFCGEKIYFGLKNIISSKDLGIKGKANYQNALAAVAIAHQAGVSFADMKEVLKNFKGLPHRCQEIGRFAEVSWLNDSKGTNVGATLAAVTGFASELTGKIVLIAGGDGKGADFSPLRNVVGYLRGCVVLGQDGPSLAKVLGEALPVVLVESIEAAVFCAQKMAQAGDGVLLSPACSSLDMFENYAKRGEIFTKAVKEFVLGHS